MVINYRCTRRVGRLQQKPIYLPSRCSVCGNYNPVQIQVHLRACTPFARRRAGKRCMARGSASGESERKHGLSDRVSVLRIDESVYRTSLHHAAAISQRFRPSKPRSTTVPAGRSTEHRAMSCVVDSDTHQACLVNNSRYTLAMSTACRRRRVPSSRIDSIRILRLKLQNVSFNLTHVDVGPC